ncbi:MAG TPA: DUF2334 domain-containing protein [Gaiellaceae bacterium]|nr:DUF2334 domain-containing protein [Gaiellaceae bacterium]
MRRGARAAQVLTAGVAAALAFLAPGSSPAGGTTRPSARVLAVSIDPADYLSETPDASALAKRLVRQFEENDVNTIYVNAYNVQYGAYYRTGYLHNVESHYGRQDLLGKLSSAAHARDIRVFAALYDHQHRGAWEANPAWREKTESGGDYNPPVTDIQYYLSPGNPQAVAWWQGFLLDLLSRYPELDGIELREPIVNWWGTTADYNPAVTRAFRTAHPDAPLGGETWRGFRQATLTRFLKEEIALIQARGLVAHVTTVATVSPTGAVMPSTWLARETGFDLDALLSGRTRPDAVKVELIWQQWARLYGRVSFTPEWTRTALRAFLRQVRGRAPVVTHVELTDFGRSQISVEEFYRTLRAASVKTTIGLDFYSSSLADAKQAWPAVRAVYGPTAPSAQPEGIAHDRRILVVHDEDARESDRQVALVKLQEAELLNLVDHFGLRWEARAVDTYQRGSLADYEAVVYLGSRYGNAPEAFVSDVSVFEGTVIWIGQNLFQLRESGVALPFDQPSQRQHSSEGTIQYRGRTLPAKGEIIATLAGTGARVVATVTGPEGTTPFILRSGRFWYVSGSPFSFLELPVGMNGRYVVFAEVLHEMLGVPHSTGGPGALLRIGGVDPLTEPARIRALANALAAERVPFLVSVTPVHVDPERDITVSLSDRPEVVAALRAAVARGGAIVAHGATHQYRGKTGEDAEFWDLQNGGGVPEDGDTFVRDRIARALGELWGNELHPLAWETPAYRATPFDYALFAETFSTFVERRVYGVVDGRPYTQPLPFSVESDIFGGRILPENLGHLGADNDVSVITLNARRLRIVRDALAGASLDVSADPAVVRTLVADLRELGYRFVDLYESSNTVEARGRIELTGSGTVSIPVPSGWYLEERAIDRSGTVVAESITGFPAYMRPARTFGETPGMSLLSLRVLSADEAGAVADGGGFLPLDASETIGFALVVLAVAGLGLLLAAYTAARIGTRRSYHR